MKTKRIISIILALIMGFSTFSVLPLTVGAASESVTVADGTDTNFYVPSYPYYKNSKAQYVIPASELVPFDGKQITALRWYFASFVSSHNIQLILSEQDGVSLEGLTDVSGYAVNCEVNEVTVDGNNELLLTFDTPYWYQGRDLVVTVISSNDSYNKANSAYGITSAGSSCSAISDSQSYDASYTGSYVARNFIPKTTLYYEDIVYYNLWVAGTCVTSVNAADLSVIDGVEGTARYDASSNTLYLDNATIVNNISGENGFGIQYLGEGILTISVSGENTVSVNAAQTSASSAISVKGKNYYMVKDGVAYKSRLISLNGKKYYLGKDCVMYKSKTFSVSGVKWRADSNGVCKKI